MPKYIAKLTKKQKAAMSDYAQKWIEIGLKTGDADCSPCIAANGENICDLEERGKRTCAASFPFGTKIIIPGFGVCTVRDRLNPKYNSRIDVFMGHPANLERARQWGLHWKKVSIIK